MSSYLMIIGLTAFVAFVILVLAYQLLPRMGINEAEIEWLINQTCSDNGYSFPGSRRFLFATPKTKSGIP